MPINIVPQNSPFKPKSLTEFITLLRRGTKMSIVESGRFLLWETFRNADFRKKYETKAQLIQAFGPRIIILGLATANNFRPNKLTIDGFYGLCTTYLQIPTSISDPEFLDNEAQQIYELLKASSTKPNHIPETKLDIKSIRFACSVMSIARGVGIQHQGFNMGVEEFYRDAHILKAADEQTGNEISNTLQRKLGLSLIQVLRSAWCTFTFAAFPNNNGLVDLAVNNFDQEFSETYNVDERTCKTIASIFSYKESLLRPDWLYGEVLKEHDYYQQYYPDPLFNKIAIQLDDNNSDDKFLIPSPLLFIRGFRQAIFTLISSEAANKGLVRKTIGDCIENHIYIALCKIFGQEKVNRLNGTGKHADFFIELNAINLIIEVKTAIGGIADKSVMNPEHMAVMWNRLYNACIQCSASIASIPEANRKLTIPVVIIGDHVTAEFMPFHAFADQAGILKELNIGPIEFHSWNSLEHVFSGTSVAQFERALLKKWKENYPKSIEDISELDLERDTPAHNYEYLNDVRKEIFIKDFL